jgi:hypothetical protein
MTTAHDNLEYLSAEATRRQEQAAQNWNALCDYVLMVASRDEHNKLTGYRPRAVSAETVVREDLLVVETRGEARLGALLAEAFLAWSADIHEPGDQASMDGSLSHAEALVLVRKHDGVRPAARATGIDKDAIWRALHRKEAA